MNFVLQWVVEWVFTAHVQDTHYKGLMDSITSDASRANEHCIGYHLLNFILARQIWNTELFSTPFLTGLGFGIQTKWDLFTRSALRSMQPLHRRWWYHKTVDTIITIMTKQETFSVLNHDHTVHHTLIPGGYMYGVWIMHKPPMQS